MTDTFRKEYKPLSQYNKDLIIMIKEKAEELEILMREVISREMSVALTNLETSIMWSTKAIVLHDEKGG